jgi:hypothetical protein
MILCTLFDFTEFYGANEASSLPSVVFQLQLEIFDFWDRTRHLCRPENFLAVR